MSIDFTQPSWEADRFPGRHHARVGAQAGARELGASVYELDPGAVGSPLHVHHANEELLLVLDGTIPEPKGFDDEVKTRAARAERAWEAATGTITFLGAGSAASIAAGVAVPPLAPLLVAVAAGSFYFKLRAKWAKEDPPRPDYQLATGFEPPRIDAMPLIDRFVPPGASIVSLLFSAGASVEATVLSTERALGAAVAEWGSTNGDAAQHRVLRLREAREHAERSKLLTRSLHVVATEFGEFIDNQALQPPAAGKRGRLVDALDSEILGRLIAAGVDLSLLAADIPEPDFEDSPADLSPAYAFSEAGDAAEDFGMALASWGHAESLRNPS